MNLTSFGTTDRGRVRHLNEDAFFADDAHRIYAVADGLGGLPGGAETSQRIIELLTQSLTTPQQTETATDLSKLIIEINEIVAKESIEAHPFTGSGSTLTIARIISDQLFIGHVGDSAAYLLRDKQLDKLTIDHTMAQELIDQEGASALESMPPEYPHTLTRCIGQAGEIRVDQTRVAIRDGDYLLLCSDGLNKVIPHEEIRETLLQTDNPEAICRQLTDQANAMDGPDNITIIAVRISDCDEQGLQSTSTRLK